MDDACAMQRALELAERGRFTVSPNPMVGCVIVTDGQVVGEGWHEAPGRPHAEVAALTAAGAAARGATAYTTLEPCTHTGRTPPCVDALVRAGVSRVVIACADPNPVASGGAEALRHAGFAVEVGLLREEAERLNEVFFHGVRTHRPFVWLKSAVSLDGRVAAADGSSQWLTGAAARRRGHELRGRVDAVLVGSGTVLADDPQLTVRLDGWRARQPSRVVLDGRGRSPAAARVFDGQARSVVLVAPGVRPDALLRAGVDVVEVPTGADGHLDPPAVLSALWARGVRSVLVEGGPTVVSAFLTSGCYERVVVHVAPLLLGEHGRPAVFGGPPTLAVAPRLVLEDVERVDGDAILQLRVPMDAGEPVDGQQQVGVSVGEPVDGQQRVLSRQHPDTDAPTTRHWVHPGQHDGAPAPDVTSRVQTGQNHGANAPAPRAGQPRTDGIPKVGAGEPAGGERRVRVSASEPVGGDHMRQGE
jgi:diaminohydroxyphosphoribosylaminopyrimidine deaminase/5-amino-6-(5-phosphoribosylamino)uracil reductase